MDILGRLRVLVWVLIIGLWGIFMYQYISDDMAMLPTIRLAKNPFSGMPVFVRVKRKVQTPAPYAAPRPSAHPGQPDSHMLSPLTGGLDIKVADSEAASLHGRSPEEKTAMGQSEAASEEVYAKPPPGFAMAQSRNFMIYAEGREVPKELIDNIENLHGNIMLDLVIFSPWTRDRKISVFFTSNQSTYQRLTGRPAWSGGTASLSARKIYLFNSEEAFGILAHELTHIYFDSFFPPEVQSPLWLSEGLATYIQSERGHSTPRWLSQNLALLAQGRGFRLNDLVRISSLQGADEDNVRLWYAQSYSVVRFLMRMRAGEAFYNFCKRLRDGAPVHQALFQSYGMPYNKLSSLEYAWRYDLKTGKISGAAY